MKTAPVGEVVFKYISIRKRIAICPSCSSQLQANPNPADEKISFCLISPFMLFLGSLFLSSNWLTYVSLCFFVLSVIGCVIKIKSSDYKEWDNWKVYKN